jgi:hypothetical protein
MAGQSAGHDSPSVVWQMPSPQTVVGVQMPLLIVQPPPPHVAVIGPPVQAPPQTPALVPLVPAMLTVQPLLVVVAAQVAEQDPPVVFQPPVLPLQSAVTVPEQEPPQLPITPVPDVDGILTVQPLLFNVAGHGTIGSQL